MKKRIKNWIYGLPVIAVLTICAVAFLAGDPFQLNVPKDSKLTAIFQQKRFAFEQLGKMFDEDSRKGLVVELTNRELGRSIQGQRKQAYQTVLSQISSRLDLTDLSESDQKGLEIIFASTGCVICDDTSKGIDYIPGPIGVLGKVVPDLDHTKDLPEGHYLCPIEPHWYISYDFYKE